MQNSNLLRDSSRGLKDYYHDYFPLGVALSPGSLAGEEAALVLKHVESITPENSMKMGPLHPREDWYSWKDAESVVAFAQRYGLKVRGHILLFLVPLAINLKGKLRYYSTKCKR